ncbi:hypothetical protein [Streptococcus merionis]|uniref:hypothetical protein n=1 Tax=Streptococcus merionis TaxID=400065 RepID=UPI0035154529
MSEKIKNLYADYPNPPYISPERDLMAEELGFKPVPRRNMESLNDGLLAGDIILLWRIAFGTFTTDSVMPKYLEFTYGIEGQKHLDILVEKGFARVESAFESLDHITATVKKAILKSKGVTGLSKLKSDQLDQILKEQLTEAELTTFFEVRGYALTDKGEKALAANQAVIDRHPQKKF